MSEGRDWGHDLSKGERERAFFARKCPRCGGEAYNPSSRWWSAYGRECRWLAEDAGGGFRCNKELRDGSDAR